MKTRTVVTSIMFGIFFTILFSSTIFSMQQAAALVSPSSHFRFAHLNWNPTGVANEAEFEMFQAVRRDGNCGPGLFTGPGGLPGIGDHCTENQGGTALFFGDGTDTGTVEIEIVALDLVGNWAFGRIVMPGTSDNWTHTYSGPGPWTAQIDSCCRTSAELNNPGSIYRISTLVDLGIANSSPISTTSPIVQCPVGLCTYPIPTIDADGDVLMYRLSTGAESGVFTQPGAGGSNGCANPLSIDMNTGVVTWDTTGCTLGLYSNSIFIEEKDAVGSAPHGNVMVDYLILVTQNPNLPPKFDVPPMSPSGTNFNVEVGVPFNTPVQCSDPEVADEVLLGNLGLPAGASVSPQVGTNPGSQIFSYTPPAVGVALVLFTCQDNNGNNAIPHSYTFNINEKTVGGQLLPIDTTALLLAGAQTSAVWILSALAVIGSVAFGALYLKTKRD